HRRPALAITLVAALVAATIAVAPVAIVAAIAVAVAELLALVVAIAVAALAFETLAAIAAVALRGRAFGGGRGCGRLRLHRGQLHAACAGSPCGGRDAAAASRRRRACPRRLARRPVGWLDRVLGHDPGHDADGGGARGVAGAPRSGRRAARLRRAAARPAPRV